MHLLGTVGALNAWESCRDFVEERMQELQGTDSYEGTAQSLALDLLAFWINGHLFQQPTKAQKMIGLKISRLLPF
jgi:hypothetical protein